MNKIYVGVDNGTTGSVCILYKNRSFYFQMPIFKELSYTKKKQNITRIETEQLVSKIRDIIPYKKLDNCCFILERPMINPGRWKASMSAIRALEATLIVIVKILKCPYRYIDSKEWQKEMLPKGLKKEELKKAAVDVAKRLFPKIITKDADSILIAEYAKRMNF